jgi:hypothetical protein
VTKTFVVNPQSSKPGNPIVHLCGAQPFWQSPSHTLDRESFTFGINRPTVDISKVSPGDFFVRLGHEPAPEKGSNII